MLLNRLNVPNAAEEVFIVAILVAISLGLSALKREECRMSGVVAITAVAIYYVALGATAYVVRH